MGSERNGKETIYMKVTDEKSLWDAVVQFQNQPFYTISGLLFHYQLKRGKHGEYTRELLIDRSSSKPLVWSSFLLAYRQALMHRGEVIRRPKELCDCRGISYSFSILWRLGLIKVPPQTEEKLRGHSLTRLEPDLGSGCGVHGR